MLEKMKNTYVDKQEIRDITDENIKKLNNALDKLEKADDECKNLIKKCKKNINKNKKSLIIEYGYILFILIDLHKDKLSNKLMNYMYIVLLLIVAFNHFCKKRIIKSSEANLKKAEDIIKEIELDKIRINLDLKTNTY